MDLPRSIISRLINDYSKQSISYMFSDPAVAAAAAAAEPHILPGHNLRNACDEKET